MFIALPPHQPQHRSQKWVETWLRIIRLFVLAASSSLSQQDCKRSKANIGQRGCGLHGYQQHTLRERHTNTHIYILSTRHQVLPVEHNSFTLHHKFPNAITESRLALSRGEPGGEKKSFRTKPVGEEWSKNLIRLASIFSSEQKLFYKIIDLSRFSAGVFCPE